MQDEGSANQWEGSDRRGMTEAKLRHVNDHLTPLAAIIVIPGLLVAPLPTRAKVAAVVADVDRGSRLPGSSRFTDCRECHCLDAARGALELRRPHSIGLDRGRSQSLDHYTDQPLRQRSQ